MKFDFEKLKDPKIRQAFQAVVGGKFASLTILEENTDIETWLFTKDHTIYIS